MLAACLVEPRRFEWREAPNPVPGPNEVVVKIEGCGICSSNLGPWKGAPWFTYPFPLGAPGHEAFGVVTATGSAVQKVVSGDRVASLSQNAFSQYCLCSADDALVLPPDLKRKTFLGEPLACAVNIFNRSGIGDGHTVAIVGIGFLGALLVQLAVRTGAKVIAAARREEALDLAARLGAQERADFSDLWSGVAAVRKLTDDRGCEVVIEATGAQAGLDFASEIAGERGRLIIAGYHQDGPRTINLQSWNWRGLDVINAHERDPAVYRSGMREALKRVLDGSLGGEDLITHRFPGEHINAAFSEAEMRKPGFLKAVLLVSSDLLTVDSEAA